MEKTIRGHLKDMRKGLVWIVIPFLILFMGFMLFSPSIASFMLDYLDINTISIHPLESITTQFRISIALSLVFMIPMVFFFLYNFVKDEVEEKIRKSVIKYFCFSYILAITGMMFGLFIFSKFTLSYLSNINLTTPMYSIQHATQFIMFSSLVLALVGQLIILVPALDRTKIISRSNMKKARFPVLISILLISAILTPPDAVSQLILALPVYLSFETGLLISKLNGGLK